MANGLGMAAGEGELGVVGVGVVAGAVAGAGVGVAVAVGVEAAGEAGVVEAAGLEEAPPLLTKCTVKVFWISSATQESHYKLEMHTHTHALSLSLLDINQPLNTDTFTDRQRALLVASGLDGGGGGWIIAVCHWGSRLLHTVVSQWLRVFQNTPGKDQALLFHRNAGDVGQLLLEFQHRRTGIDVRLILLAVVALDCDRDIFRCSHDDDTTTTRSRRRSGSGCGAVEVVGW
jgi:hypothetical protein